MTFASAFVAFFVSHHVGDYLLQTEWQASHKAGGLRRGAREARRALVAHVATYTLAFVPALVWIATESTGALAVAVAALIALPHLVVDDGRLVRAYVTRVKRVLDPDRQLVSAVDQSTHLVLLFGAALVAAAVT